MVIELDHSCGGAVGIVEEPEGPATARQSLPEGQETPLTRRG